MKNQNPGTSTSTSPAGEAVKPQSDDRRQLDINNELLEAIIKPMQRSAYETTLALPRFFSGMESLSEDYGGLDLDPDYQRGRVWTTAQQTLFLENMLRGVISSSGFVVQFNCPNWDMHDTYQGDLPLGFQCIDGLQRITAVQQFLKGEIKPFNLTPSDLANSSYNPSNYRFTVAIHAFKRKEDLLAHYLDLNRGGTPHSESELERVQSMLETLRQGRQ